MNQALHHHETRPTANAVDFDRYATVSALITSDWRHRLPVLEGHGVTLRALRLSDAASLLAALTVAEVTRFISPPPTTIEGFERFIAWTEREQAAGKYICFAVVPHGDDTAIGLIQVRRLDPTFATGEWGFAIAAPYWGTGVFQESAKLVVDFVIEDVGVRRLEARATVTNARGNGALRKLGAVQEAILHHSFLRDGEYTDQVLWSIDSDAWLQAKAIWGAKAVWGPRFH